MADSVAEYSTVQGQDSWYYGYVDPASSLAFQLLPHVDFDYPTQPPAWVIDTLPPSPPFGDQFFTALWDNGGHTNALLTSANKPREHWVVRRWISELDGPIDISGMVGDFSAYDLEDQDGVLAEIYVDGSPIWSLQTDGHLMEIPYAVSTSVSLGSIVDFVVKPGASDYTDQFTFTAVIETPEPTTWLLAAVAGLALFLRSRGRAF